MPRSHPHPRALFSLKPNNGRARDVVAHPCNRHLVSTLKDGVLALHIGSHIRSKSCNNNTLATLGRNDTDIILEESSIARMQCSFETDPVSSVVMLYDRSHGQTTQVFGENVTPFEHGRIRKVLVQEDLNTVIGMGGVRCNLVQFQLVWHQNPTETVAKVKKQVGMPCGHEENPRLAQTVDEAATILPSQRLTRIQTPGTPPLRIRYVKIGEPLGSGQFGVVHKSIDVDSGKFMAVKTIQRPTQTSKQEEWRVSLHYALKREVETLAQISHPYLVDFIGSQGWGESVMEIFMGLKEGTLESLVESTDKPPASVPDSVFPQMLQALDCLAWNGIIHRDVKPANILYISQPDGQYQFQLGDFGLCNRAISAVTRVGSPPYMAPEMFHKGVQTSKVDVWSLFVTMLWTLNVGEFRHHCNRFEPHVNVWDAISSASKLDPVSKIQEMAIHHPEKRASAAQMLVKWYNGQGLSTPRNQVPALHSTPSPAIAAPSSVPAPPTRAEPPTKPAGLHENANIFAPAAQYAAKNNYNLFRAQPFRRL